ncbi:MAG TPA: MFS transporter [Longimicrobiaceae bacterium]|nr:MFS transporter [Longimicrobiaceae bacterium]
MPDPPAADRRLRAFVSDVRGLPRAAWVVYAGTFINRFGSFVVTFLILILVRRGLSPAQAGLAASAYGVGALCASALGGHLADHLGRRRTIALSMFLSAAAMLTLWRVQGLALTVAVTAAAGVSAELYRPAAAALLADVTPVGRRVGTYALYRTAINAGFALGPAMAGFFIARSVGYVFVGDAVTSVLYGLLVLAAIPRSLDAASTPRSAAAARERGPSALRLIAADRGLLAVLATGLVVSFVHHQDMASFPLEVRWRGMAPAQFGMLISLNGLTCMLLELPIAAITSRARAWIPMSVGAALTGLGMASVLVAPNLAALAACVLVWTVGEICYWPVASAFVADLAPPGLQGRYQAAHGFTSSGGLMLAPALGPALFALSRGGLWTLCGVLGCAASATFVLLGRARHVRSVEAELASGAVLVDGA